MSAAHLMAIMAAGDLAVELWRAEAARNMAKEAYIARVRKFEGQFGDVPHNAPADDPDRLAMNQFTRARYESFVEARRKVYSLRRRLKLACEKAARASASTASKRGAT